MPETDEGLSPYSKYEFKDIKYWLKYCAYATLASILSLPPNWGTGLPPPLLIPFPTVYIPIKAFQLSWGILVIGITLTGIYPFPWVMIANLSTQYHVPLIDPATILNKSIDTLKLAIQGELKSYRKDRLEKSMKRTQIEIQQWNNEIEKISAAQATLKVNKPKRDRADEAGLTVDTSINIKSAQREAGAVKARKDALLTYADELSTWNISRVALVEEMLTAKRKRYTAEVKYKILLDASNDIKIEDPIDPEIESMQKAEEAIDNKFNELGTLTESVNIFLEGLPVSTEDYSANFAFTLKSPKPITQMANHLDEQINNPLLDKITKPFDLDREDLMSSNYGSKLDNSILNAKKYTNVLVGSMIPLIPIDPFPKYEMLKATNLAWTLKFLLPSWAPTGGKLYGFPGFPKYPI